MRKRNVEEEKEPETFGNVFIKDPFPDGYKELVFLTWIENDRPDVNKLKTMIDQDIYGRTPNFERLKSWINQDFVPRANKISATIEPELAQKEFILKSEMLERHAEAGKKMIEWSMDYLEKNLAELRPTSALRMLELGLKTERQARGLPELLAQINSASDEELQAEIMKLLETGDVVDSEFLVDYNDENKTK